MNLTRLRDALAAADYTTDAVLARIGDAGQAGLGRNSTVPADQELAGAHDELATLIRLFILQQPVSVSAAEQALGLTVGEPIAGVQLTSETATGVRARVDLRPYASPDDGATGYLVSDLTPGLDGAPVRPSGDYVLGASPASLTLAQLTMRQPITSALDLGTGCGVQALHLAKHAQHVTATDLNPRAIQLAKLGAALSGAADIDFRTGSLFDPVVGERFDLIVSNPPYVMSPTGSARLTYRETNQPGDQLVHHLVTNAATHLNPGGSMQLLTNWAVLSGQPWQERLTGWAHESGLDCWVVERERLDRYAYIEMWLTDAGLLGTDNWRAAYLDWLAYFESLGIEEVGMGWILLTAAERDDPHVRIESWPHPVQQPVGEMMGQVQSAVTAARLSDEQLLASLPKLTQVVQESLATPGANDPNHIILRQQTGMLRAMQVDTTLGAVLGALDGELPLHAVLDAVANLLEVAADDVRLELLPQVRQALCDQYLELE